MPSVPAYSERKCERYHALRDQRELVRTVTRELAQGGEVHQAVCVVPTPASATLLMRRIAIRNPPFNPLWLIAED